MNLDRVVERCIVPHDTKIGLGKDYDPSFKLDDLSREDAESMLQAGVLELADYQDKLFAQANYALLIIFQGMDASGKDSTIKHVMSGLNPQGCQALSFKTPSVQELEHDYLWRCARALPKRGSIGVFNRSYYEEVLIARVHPDILDKQNLPPEARDKNIWERRFAEINNFERYLVDNGVLVLKFFLNISKKEQMKRFLERIDTPRKNWKFSVDDAREREYWDKYQKAYEDCFNNTSTKWAPWHIIPANYKPFARLLVSHIVCQKLKSLDLHYPTVTPAMKEQLAQSKQLLESESD